MKKKRWPYLAIAATLLAMLAISCGGDDDDSGEDDESDDDSDDDNSDDDSGDDDSAIDCPDEDRSGWTVGLVELSSGAYNGYTLLAPTPSTNIYLLDVCGRVVHTWDSDHVPGQATYLLESGELFRTISTGNNRIFTAGGAGGGVELLDWDGNVVWEYEYNSSTYIQHHDAEMLPDGNVLILAWELKSRTEAIAAGRNPSRINNDGLWPDHIIEVEPSGSSGGTIVWEWHMWDHLIQDYDSGKDNYGVVANHPELIDLNYATSGVADWTHTNAVDYNAEFDQIVISVHNFSELMVIDHSTTTAQAASHSGGNSDMGGDILYRWGNPQAYDSGDLSDEKFFAQHDAHWIEEGLPGEGDLMVFNNGTGRGYSTVDEIVPPVDANGDYDFGSGSSYGPDEQTWIYKADNPSDFFSGNISGAQRQPNGNTLICSGANGTIFEVTDGGDTVWEYVNPVTNRGVLSQGDSVSGQGSEANSVFRAYRYPSGYAGLDGRDLTAGDYIEN